MQSEILYGLPPILVMFVPDLQGGSFFGSDYGPGTKGLGPNYLVQFVFLLQNTSIKMIFCARHDSLQLKVALFTCGLRIFHRDHCGLI